MHLKVQVRPGGPAGGADAADLLLCDLVDSCAADGFAIMPALYPSSVEDFVDGVSPELRRRGRLPTTPTAGTLRDRLGLPA
ncbi:hypothetical protein [Salana multivorans]